MRLEHQDDQQPEEPSTSPMRLKTQIDLLMKMNGEINASRKYPRPPEDEKFVADFFSRFIVERDKRAVDVESPDVREAAAIARKMIHYTPYGVLCIDGRVLPPLIAGYMAGLGGFMRVPAGDLHEFVMGRDGNLALLKHSHFAHQLDHILGNNDKVMELLDSHLSCAARLVDEELATGLHPGDGGLYADVVRKREIELAIRKYVDDKHPGKKVLPVQFSFDPHNGYGYMGLENDEALSFAKEHGGFSANVLNDLIARGTLISTEQVASLPEFISSFEKWAKAFELNTKDNHGQYKFNWSSNYPQTAIGFWKAMYAMREKLLPLLIHRLEKVYPWLKRDEPLAHEELHERAMLLLANAFSGYLNNLNGYQYAEHNEECVVVTEREHGPFAEISSFIVFSNDLKNLPKNTVFASSIVRANRKNGRVNDSNFEDPSKKDAYTSAPVPVIVHEIIRDEVDPKVWQALEKTQWDDLEGIRWRDLSTAEFMDYLTEKIPNLPLAVARAIDRLRQKMTFLYNPEKDSARFFVNGNLVAMPMIVDQSRRPHAIIPFIKKGFHT